MENDAYFEKIMGKMEYHDIRTNEHIMTDKKKLLDHIYGPYMCYNNNVANRREAEDKLNKYEYVDSFDSLNKYDLLMMIDADQFFDIKCHFQGKYFRYNESRKTLGMRFNNRNIPIDFGPNRFFFRKLNKKDILKILLVESIDQIKN
jgi:hypothetical protein